MKREEGKLDWSDFDFVRCPSCISGNLVIKYQSGRKCNRCGEIVPLRGNILECRTDSSSNRILRQWQLHYANVSNSYSANEDWWTLTAWRSHLFSNILGELHGKFVLDVGCGTAARVAELAPVQEYNYCYMGVDSSLDALHTAARNIPNGLFINADLRSLRLEPEVADVILCLGVLMYFEDSSEILVRILDSLKPGGVLLLHEPLSRKSWRQLFRGLLPTSGVNFPSAYTVSPDTTRDELEERGTILRAQRGGSPMRTPMVKLLNRLSMARLRPSSVWLDSVYCATIGRLFPTVGASEVQIVFRKTASLPPSKGEQVNDGVAARVGIGRAN